MKVESEFLSSLGVYNDVSLLIKFNFWSATKRPRARCVMGQHRTATNTAAVATATVAADDDDADDDNDTNAVVNLFYGIKMMPV